MTFRTSIQRLGALAVLVAAGLAGTAHAAGTPAGQSIDNTAKLDYSVGGTPQTQICSSPSGNSTSTCTPTTFKVDQKVNLTITTSNASPGVSAVPGSTSTLTFTVTNLSNATQLYGLSTFQSAAGTSASPVSVTNMFGGGATSTVSDTFDANTCKIYNSTAPTTQITSVSLAADAGATLYVVCSIPLSLTNTDVAAVTLKATAWSAANTPTVESVTNDPTVTDIAFADGAGTPDDGPRDGAYSARSAYKVNTAAVSVTKSFITLCDPAGGAVSASPAYAPKSIPGAYVQYTVTVANAATPNVAAILTNLVDTLDTTRVTFDTELITGANVSASVPGCSPTTPAGPNAGTAASAGNSYKVTWSGGTRAFFGGTSGTRYVALGSTYSGSTITFPWSSVLPADATNNYAAGELKAGDTVTLTFNVIIK